MSEPGDFRAARLDRLAHSDSGETSPAEALEIAQRLIAENDHHVRVVIALERSDGRFDFISSQTTHAQAVFLLEAAKLHHLIGYGET